MRRGFLVVVLFIGAVALVTYEITKLVRTPRSMWLADCTNDTVNATFTCPTGVDFNFVVSIRGATNPSQGPQPTFSARILVKQADRTIHEFIASQQSWIRWVWIDRDNHLGGYIVSLPSSGQNRPLSSYFEARQRYEVSLVFSDRPSDAVSLWLIWHQNRRESRLDRSP